MIRRVTRIPRWPALGRNRFHFGWGARDEQFNPIIREFYYTSTYGGLEHTFGDSIHVRAVGKYLRSWRVEQAFFAVAQALIPAGSVEYNPARSNWSFQVNAAYSRNMGSTLRRGPKRLCCFLCLADQPKV